MPIGQFGSEKPKTPLKLTWGPKNCTQYLKGAAAGTLRHGTGDTRE